MARIELRDCTIRIKDGLSGTGSVNEPTTGALASPAVTTVDGVESTSDEIVTLAQYAVNFSGGTFTLTFNLDGEDPFTTAPIAYNANAAAIQTAIDVAATAASIAGWTNGHITVAAETTNLLDGDITLTFDGTSVTDTNHGATTLDGAGLTSSVLNGATNLDVDTIALNTTDTDLVPVGARFTVAGEAGSPVHTVTQVTGNPTTNIVFTPALLSGGGVFNNAAITFLPQQIDIKIGDGNLTYTEAKEYEYELDRGNLDAVREGNEVPMEVNLEFVYEHVRTGTNESVSPVDALKGKNGAAGWVSSSADLCEPYCVDIEVLHEAPCGTSEDETTLFPEFRHDSLDFDFSEAAVSVTGRCNASEPIVTRG